MAAMLAVKPARKGMALSHPVSGLLPDEGGSWVDDQFTARRLIDKDVKLDGPREEAKAEPVTAASDSDAPAPGGAVVNPDPAPSARAKS